MNNSVDMNSPGMKLAREIIKGRRLGRGDDLSDLCREELENLCAGADLIRKELCGNKVDLCTIINGRSGRCSENCKFCAQSCHYNTSVNEYPFMESDDILADAKKIEATGVGRYSIVTAGRSIRGEEFEKAVSAYQRLSAETNLKLCASHGFQTVEEYRRLKEAGADRAHCNIETSKRYFPFICTTHTYEDKIANIKRAQEAGLSVCSGGIFGMGETLADRIDMAFDLAELGITSIPINILRPIPGTPFQDLPAITNEEVLRSVAIFRYINPEAFVRIAAGRGQFEDGGAVLFESGANSAITGDMLTTTGTDIAYDLAMFERLGFVL